MEEISLYFSGRHITVVYGCLKPLRALEFQDLVKRAAEDFGEEEWLALVKDCCRLPPRELIVSSLLYALRNYYSGRMITRALAYEFLAFSLADRNISRIKDFFGGGSRNTVGYVGVAMREGSEFKNKLLSWLTGLRMEPCGFEEDCWISEYSSYLGVPAERERLLSILRARAALLALSV